MKFQEMEYFTTLIIEDEPIAAEGLQNLLSKYYDDFLLLDMADSGPKAVKLIDHHKPNLIFLDVELRGFNGFEVLKQITHQPKVIFTTAYDHYAIKAFEENGLDYLLKPIEPIRLKVAIDRFKTNQLAASPDFQKLFDLLKTPKVNFPKIAVNHNDKIIFIDIEKVTYFNAEARYVMLNIDTGNRYLSTYSINGLEKTLPENFIRISRSLIVNVNFISIAEKYFGGNFRIVLSDKKQTTLETGRKYVENFKKLFWTF